MILTWLAAAAASLFSGMDGLHINDDFFPDLMSEDSRTRFSNDFATLDGE
jgi:hypothetical protein